MFPHDGVVSSIAIDPVSKSIWTASLDGFVRRWDRDVGGEDGAAWASAPTVCLDLQAPVLSMSVDSERQLVCAGSADGGGVILDAITGNITSIWVDDVLRPSGGTRAITFVRSHGHDCVVMGGSNGSVRLRRLKPDEQNRWAQKRTGKAGGEVEEGADGAEGEEGGEGAEGGEGGATPEFESECEGGGCVVDNGFEEVQLSPSHQGTCVAMTVSVHAGHRSLVVAGSNG